MKRPPSPTPPSTRFALRGPGGSRSALDDLTDLSALTARRAEPMRVHLAHYRGHLAHFAGIPPRVNSDWMIFMPLRAHRFRCPLGVLQAPGAMCYVLPPGLPFATEQPAGYAHYSAHLSDAGHVGWEATVAAARRVEDASWLGTPLTANPVTLALADARWRLWTDARERADLIASFSTLVSCFQTGDAFRSRIALTQLLDRVRAVSRSHPLERLRPFTEHLLHHLADDVPIGALAQACGISRMQLHRLCLQAYGRPPREVLLQERLGLAQQLLDGGLGVQQTATACGFSDPYYFSRLFRRRLGQPPSRWRFRAGVHPV